MWLRLLIAAIGGSTITFTMFYGMSEVAEIFTRRSPDLYYQVMDFIPGTGGPRRPQLILPEDQPDRPRIEFEPGGTIVIDATPQFTDDASVAAPPLKLDAPAAESP